MVGCVWLGGPYEAASISPDAPIQMGNHQMSIKNTPCNGINYESSFGEGCSWIVLLCTLNAQNGAGYDTDVCQETSAREWFRNNLPSLRGRRVNQASI